MSNKSKKINKLELGETACDQVNLLIDNGWEFSLHYGDHEDSSNIKGFSWEAYFTKRKSNRLWDNHEPGYDISPDGAIDKAYNNIKNGIRLIKK